MTNVPYWEFALPPPRNYTPLLCGGFRSGDFVNISPDSHDELHVTKNTNLLYT